MKIISTEKEKKKIILMFCYLIKFFYLIVYSLMIGLFMIITYCDYLFNNINVFYKNLLVAVIGFSVGIIGLIIVFVDVKDIMKDVYKKKKGKKYERKKI